MSASGPHRIGTGGRHIDRSARLRFTFDGKELQGYRGDTLASALLANGQRLVARSYKLHRPRGVMAAGVEEPNAYLGVGRGATATPNQRATETLLEDGMEVASQNRFPNLKWDLGAVNTVLSRLLPAGFYYKTFMFPRAAWHRLYEPLIRRAAGMGRAPRKADPDQYEQFYLHTDVLVVGAGPAGLAAGRAAAEAGARVLLVEQTPWAGGRLLADGVAIDGTDGGDWAANEAEALARLPGVDLRFSTLAAALYDHNYALLYERPNVGVPVRRRLWRVRAEQVVLAAGAIERPVVFADNDRPGVMLASAVRDYLQRWAVAPGTRAVVYTGNDDAYRTALAMDAAALQVACIVDARSAPDGPLVAAVRERGIRILEDSGIVAVHGHRAVRAVEIAPVRASGRPGAPCERVECDLVAVSGGWSPTAHLYCHAGGRLRWDSTRAMFLADPDAPPASVTGMAAVHLAGAAAGALATRACLETGADAGARAAVAAGKGTDGAPGRLPTTDAPAEGAAGGVWMTPGLGRAQLGDRHFIDYQHDVTLADLELAAREGYSSVEHAKRYTTLGMAADQGKVSNVPGHSILAEVTGRQLDASGTTTIRPPYSGISLGAIAGTQSGAQFRAVRATPPFAWHLAHGADFEPVGDWRRPYCYPRSNESRAEAVAREISGVRRSVGMIDASTLGKLLVSGPDAGVFLDRIYTNMMSTLRPGRCRYGLMCNDAGFLFDDGVVVRLDEDTFLCHTTSGGVGRVHAWLETWLQTEWLGLKVFVVNVTEQWAQVAVAGPRAREVLQPVVEGIDISEEALPPLAMAQGVLEGVPARVFSISFSGELGYEVAVPAGFGASLWESLLQAGAPHGMVAYGTEALHVMRAEKGYIMIGDETDGTVTPIDLGLGWAVSRKKEDFLGMRGMAMPHLAAAGRRQLVGLLTEAPQTVIPDGACAVGGADGKRIVGHVTSSYHSPTLGRSIAMALVEGGRDRMGEVLKFSVARGDRIRARVVKPAFLENAAGGDG